MCLKGYGSLLKIKELITVGYSITQRVNGTVFNTCRDKASVFNEYFISVSTKEDTSHTPLLDGYSFLEISPIGVTIAGVTALLSTLKTHKASGPDKIPAPLLKILPKTLAPTLTMIFKAFLSILTPITMENSLYHPSIQEG